MVFSRSLRSMFLVAPLALCSACLNPYACRAEYRFAEYKGILGVDEPIEREVGQREPGRVYLSVDQQRGVDPYEQVHVSVNVWGFVDSVSEIHIHRATAPNVGRLLFSSTSGYMVRDSVWNEYPQRYSGPVSWSELWSTLEDGDAYFEIHTGTSPSPVRARLTFSRGRGFQPSCT